MESKDLWNLFCETGDPVCYLIVKNIGENLKPAGGKSGETHIKSKK